MMEENQAMTNTQLEAELESLRSKEGLRQKFLGELRWFADMIDTLRVEDTRYGGR